MKLPRLKLRPEEQAELGILLISFVAYQALGQLVSRAYDTNTRAAELDDEVTRLKAANDQLGAHNEQLEVRLGWHKRRNSQLCERVAELTSELVLVQDELEHARPQEGGLDVDAGDEHLSPHHD